MAHWHKRVTVKAMLWVWSLLEEMNYYLIIISFLFLALVRRQIAVLPLNTQCLQNSAESEEEPSVLTLGSLCLPCYMRDTGEWTWKKRKRSWCWIIFPIYVVDRIDSYNITVGTPIRHCTDLNTRPLAGLKP